MINLKLGGQMQLNLNPDKKISILLAFNDSAQYSLLVSNVDIVSIMFMYIYLFSVNLKLLNTAMSKGWTR